MFNRRHRVRNKHLGLKQTKESMLFAFYHISCKGPWQMVVILPGSRLGLMFNASSALVRQSSKHSFVAMTSHTWNPFCKLECGEASLTKLLEWRGWIHSLVAKCWWSKQQTSPNLLQLKFYKTCLTKSIKTQKVICFLILIYLSGYISLYLV